MLVANGADQSATRTPATSAEEPAAQTSVVGADSASIGSEEAQARWYADAKGLNGEPAAKEADSAAPPAAVPDKYELALEGVDLDPTMVGEAEPVLREIGLTNDAANKLVPIANKLVTSTQERTMQALIDAGSKQRKAWLDAYHSDPHIGGASRAETELLAEQGMAALGFKAGHPFRRALTESGFGNHPDMIRTFRRLGELASGRGQPGGAAKDIDARWYGGGM